MKRRTPRGRTESSQPTPTRPGSARRKPAWNAYLTDDTQYKLNQQQQLQRTLQQLSAAHFSARSPGASTSRRRLAKHSSAWSTPQDLEKGRERLADVTDTGELKTARRLQFADVSLDLEEPTPRRRAAAVSFQVQEAERMDPEHKANLQGELEVLERMLWELETETERLSWQQTPQKEKMQQRHKSPRTGLTTEQEEEEDTFYEQEEAVQEVDVGGEKEDGEGEDEEAEKRLGDVCYKSLEVGLELARKMDTLKKELDNERRLREDRDLKIDMLEQEVRSTQAKCNYLEAKYQGVASQVDGMREAVIATEEAIHRMTVAFEYSQRRRGKASNPSTPNKPAVSRPIYANEPLNVSKKAATPKKPSVPVEQQENWTPNGQH
ncbi:hypothetical protein PRIC2_005173 [Phytophthora ramorum]